jgi:Tfp pilus assembly protein PilX
MAAVYVIVVLVVVALVGVAMSHHQAIRARSAAMNVGSRPC